MLPLLLPIHLRPRGYNNELSITDQLLNIRPCHQPILLDQFRGVDHVPLIRINLIAIGHNDIEVVIEADPVDSEPVHIHFYLEKVAHVDGAVSG